MFLRANADVMFRETELPRSYHDERFVPRVAFNLRRSLHSRCRVGYAGISKSDLCSTRNNWNFRRAQKPPRDEQVLRDFNNCLTDFAVGYSIATEIRETVPGHDGFIAGLPASHGRPQHRPTKAHREFSWFPRNIVKLGNWEISALNSGMRGGDRIGRDSISVNVYPRVWSVTGTSIFRSMLARDGMRVCGFIIFFPSRNPAWFYPFVSEDVTKKG